MKTDQVKSRRPYASPVTRVLKIRVQHILCQSLQKKNTPTPYQW